MKRNLSNQSIRSNSQCIQQEEDLKKLFPFTQQYHMKYLQTNRLSQIKDDLSDQQQQQISNQIKELLNKDKNRSKKSLDEITPTLSPRFKTKERAISVLKKSSNQTIINYHDSQNHNLYEKSLRKDMIQLGQWMDLVLEQIKQNTILTNYQEFYNKIEVIFSGCILELQRLLEQKGYEFGQFLKKFWEQFTNYNQMIIQGLNQKAKDAESQSLEELHKIHLHYQNLMSKQVDEMQLIKRELQQIQQFNLIFEKENQYLRTKDQRREKQLRDLINDKYNTSIELVDLKGIINQQKRIKNAELDQYQNHIFDFFQKQFENQYKFLELQYRNFQIQDIYFDHSNDTITKDKNIQVEGLIKFKDQFTNTNQYIYQDVSTQTHKQKKQITQEIQVQPITCDQEIQVTIYQIKKEKMLRNQFDSSILKMARSSILDIINTFQIIEFPFNQLKSYDENYQQQIEHLITTIKLQTQKLIDLIILRNDVDTNDMYGLKHYFYDQLNQTLENYQQIWSIVLGQQVQIMETIIEKNESLVELQIVQNQFIQNMNVLKQYQTKQLEEQKIWQFYKESLIKTVRYAPQTIINQIQQQAQIYKVLNEVEFKEIKRRALADSRFSISPKGDESQLGSSRFSPLKQQNQSNQSQTQIKSLKQIISVKILKAQRSMEIDLSPMKPFDELQELESNTSKEENNEDNLAMLMSELKMDLIQTKPELTLEKKFRIHICPSKYAKQATNTLKLIIKRFKSNNMNGLYTLTTLLQYYTDFLLTLNNINSQTPLHVYLFEYIGQKYGQTSSLNDQGRYKRIIKSFLYYQHRHSTCNIVTNFLKGEYDLQDFTNYLQIFKISNLYPELECSQFIYNIQNWLLENHYEQDEIQNIIIQLKQSTISYLIENDQIVEFDLIMNCFLSLFQQYKNKTSKLYKDIFECFELQDKGVICFQQWNLLYKNLVSKNMLTSLKLFYTEADYHDNEKLMSKQRFTQISDEKSLFTLEQQSQLLDHSTFQEIFMYLIKQWQYEKIFMKMQFIKNNQFNQVIKQLFQVIDRSLKNQQQIEQACYAYKILNNTCKQLIQDAIINDVIIESLLQINETFYQFHIKIIDQ